MNHKETNQIETGQFTSQTNKTYYFIKITNFESTPEILDKIIDITRTWKN